MKFRVVSFLTFLSFLLLTASCARTGRPSGGPKDEDAPIMISGDPDHETINFKEEKIRLYFNEYIKLNDLNNQLVISPPMKHAPVISPVGTASDVISIRITDTLLENTTYTLNFGNSVEDNNEGNPLEQFKYVFSTGDYIDSLAVTGTISDAYNLELDENISVQLYEVTEEFTDSIVFKERPSYVANALDSIGFELTNLKEGKYLMIALKDASKNYTFEPKVDKIGFYSNLITLPTDSVYHLKVFQEILDFKNRRPNEIKKGHIYFAYEGDPKEIKIDLLSDKPANYKSKLVFEKNMDTISYWYTPIEADSLLFKVSNKDIVDTLMVKLRSKEMDSLIVGAITKGTLSMRDTFAIGFNIPIHKINKAQIKILDKDSLPVNFTTHLDDSNQIIKLNFEKNYEEKYKFEVLPNAFEDLFGNVNDTLNFSATTKNLDTYCTLQLRLHNIESFPYILELLDKSGELIHREYTASETYFKFENLDPSEFGLRIIYDTNENGKWDTGNFLKKIQPEKVVYYNTPIEVRANWEVVEDFDLSKAKQ